MLEDKRKGFFMKKIMRSVLLIAFTAIFLVACTSNNSTVIRVGSKNFTENLIIGEIYSLALEDNGFEVERVDNIASSVIPQAIENDEIDIYPEYTGTALLSIHNLPMESDPQTVATQIRDAYEEMGLTTLDFAEANNSQGIAMNRSTAEELGIQTISDLQANAESVRFASQGEFNEREDGLPGLSEVYGEFNFASNEIYDNSLKYTVLENDEADATPAYTTDGQLVNTEQFIVLEDDKQFWPPYNVVPVVRQDTLDENPEMADIINQVNANLDTESLIQLNARVDIDGEPYEDVAADFFESINQ